MQVRAVQGKEVRKEGGREGGRGRLELYYCVRQHSAVNVNRAPRQLGKKYTRCCTVVVAGGASAWSSTHQ